MDGHFVPNMSFGSRALLRHPPDGRSCPIDVHLMVNEPSRFFDWFVKAGCGYPSLPRGGGSAYPPLPAASARARRESGRCAQPRQPAVAVKEVLPYRLRPLWLVMSVNPGFGGRKFIPESLSKIAELRSMIDERGLATEIEVDGGVNPETAKHCVQAGATVLVAGSRGVQRTLSKRNDPPACAAE